MDIALYGRAVALGQRHDNLSCVDGGMPRDARSVGGNIRIVMEIIIRGSDARRIADALKRIAGVSVNAEEAPEEYLSMRKAGEYIGKSYRWMLNHKEEIPCTVDNTGHRLYTKKGLTEWLTARS